MFFVSNLLSSSQTGRRDFQFNLPSRRPVGQGRTSSRGIRGIVRKVESASCRFPEMPAGSNPTLTASLLLMT
jgi:hypothetical protein